MSLENLQIAALLHDIGKAWERTQRRRELDFEFQKISKVDYAHPKWSANFIRKFHHLFEDPKIVEKMVLYHHNPETEEEEMIKVADGLSSAEREEKEDESTMHRSNTPLVSIFSKISGIKSDPPQKRHHYSLKKLTLAKKTIFPKLKNVEIGTDFYKNLWRSFEEELEKLVKIDLITLYYLLKKYTWSIPSATPSYRKYVPDVSLFDHLKTTCAIATCLYKNNGKKEFLLIGGDISGVQKFIYSITSKGAAKSLRGKSFYLELLSETIAKFILDRLGLPITNLLFCGGGHFYILAPGNIVKELEKIQMTITKKLLEIHSGDLYLVMNWIQLTEDDFKVGVFGKIWHEIGKKLAEKKKHKFSEVLDVAYERIFGPTGKGKEICDVCERESEHGLIEEEDIKKCPLCKSFEKLAKQISKANYIIQIKNDKEKRILGEGTWNWAISKFGYRYEFREEVKEDIKKIKADHITIFKLNDSNFLDNCEFVKEAYSPISFGFKFLMNTPLKEFDELADTSVGVKKWGILRADVDNLGRIFAEGLGDRATISRISTLSSMLSLYFTGWINKICERYRDNIYGIYSGGDDLFIVGSWDKLPELSKDIYDDFRKYTCQNPNITLSSGISMAPNKKYPLYRAAQMAGDSLENSKEVKGKDAITFLEETIKWKDFDDVINLKDALNNLIEKDEISRGFIQKLYLIYLEFEKQRQNKNITLAKHDDRYGRWRWLLAYLIARVAKKENRENLEDFHKIFREKIEHSPSALRWVEFLTRKEEDRYE